MTKHSGLERLILLQLGKKPTSFLSIQIAIGHDKGQISRALKNMEKNNLVMRTQLRAPFMLTTLGEQLHKKALKIVIQRTKALVNDISLEKCQWFYAALNHLVDNISIRCDKKTIISSDSSEIYKHNPSAIFSYVNEINSEDTSIKIIPKLYRLLFLIRQDLLSIYKKTLNLTGFESEVLVCVKHTEPTTITVLSQYLRRDKGQIGRTIKNLCDKGLLIRKAQKHTKRQGIYLTGKGNEMYREQQVIAIKMDVDLLEGLDKNQTKELFALLQHLNINATQMEHSTET